MAICWFGRHRWKPRAVTYYKIGDDGVARTNLLEICTRCGRRRETSYMGQRQLSDFMATASEVVEELLKER